ncbi:site-specific integrase [Methanorbis rubei]
MIPNTRIYERKDLKSFLSEYNDKKTGKNYRVGIGMFLREIYPESGGNELEVTNPLSVRYLNEIEAGRDYIADLRRVGDSYCDGRYAPISARKNLQIVIIWLQANGAVIQYWERRKIFAKMPIGRPVSAEYELKRKMIRNVVETLPEWGRVLTLVLAGSGMRIGETMKLRKQDVDWSQRPVKVSVRAEYTKGKIPRVTMLTAEAAEALQQYLSGRTDADDRLFPYAKESFEWHWRRGVDAMGYGERDPITGHRLMHIHMLRKWFISRFSLVARKEVAEFLAGHTGYLSMSYTRFTHKQLAKQFLKAEKKISILSGDTELPYEERIMKTSAEV